jgi:prepilin-type N-terminal cleavage/methylation domain-containing protein
MCEDSVGWMFGKSGFTLIEMIITIVLVSIVMIPIALIAAEFVRSTVYADSLTMAANLGRQEMAIVNNLSYADPTLADGYDHRTTNYAGYPYDVRRAVNSVIGTNDNLKRVMVDVFPRGSATRLIELVTYVMDVEFG